MAEKAGGAAKLTVHRIVCSGSFFVYRLFPFYFMQNQLPCHRLEQP